MTTQSLTLPIVGMTCASCVSPIEGAQANLPGGTDKVTYLPAAATPTAMNRAIRDLGYEVGERVEGQAAMDREREARQREIRRQGVYLAFAGPVSILVMLGT